MMPCFSPTSLSEELKCDEDARNALKNEIQGKKNDVKENHEQEDEENGLEKLEAGLAENREKTTEGETTEESSVDGGGGGGDTAEERQKEVEQAAERHLSGLLDSTLQRNPLPRFCVYLTWLLLLATIATCAFFLLLYSMQWGATTSEEWLASFFASFAESLFLFEPVKVGGRKVSSCLSQ